MAVTFAARPSHTDRQAAKPQKNTGVGKRSRNAASAAHVVHGTMTIEPRSGGRNRQGGFPATATRFRIINTCLSVGCARAYGTRSPTVYAIITSVKPRWGDRKRHSFAPTGLEIIIRSLSVGYARPAGARSPTATRRRGVPPLACQHRKLASEASILEACSFLGGSTANRKENIATNKVKFGSAGGRIEIRYVVRGDNLSVRRSGAHIAIAT